MAGVVHYFEPNDLEFNNEDLCIGVKLEVDVPGRALSSSNGGTHAEWQTVIDNVDLFGNRKEGYMTTSYSDVSSLSSHEGGNMDSIGIESINIRYNSWYYPEVDIKFIDLRGNAVMNPIEARRDGRNETGSFLNALFSFPYPLFRLTVKGYYGHPVLYKLTVRDVRSNFNPQTGNFEFQVKFIGFMFGYMNDLPMQYLLVAPHIDYGGLDSDLGYFHYNSSGEQTPIPTFTKFLSSVAEALAVTDQDEDLTAEKTTTKNLEDLKAKVYSLHDMVDRFKNDLMEDYSFALFKCTEDPENHIYTLEKRDKTSKGETVTDEMYKRKINEMNNSLVYIRKYYDEVSKLRSINKISLIENQNDEHFNPSSATQTITFNHKADLDTLSNIEAQINAQKEVINNAVQGIYKSKMGWDPTIGNIVEMVIAHVDKLRSKMEKCMNDIDNNRSQRLMTNVVEKTDVKVINKSEATCPPFPLITNGDRKYMWIKDSTSQNLRSFDEGNFIESVIRGAVSHAKEAAKTVQDFSIAQQYVGFPPGGLPTLLTDRYDGNGDFPNPYENESVAQTGNGIPPALKVFAKRLALRYLFFDGQAAQLSPEVFAKMEAANLYMANNTTDKRAQIKQWDSKALYEGILNYLNGWLKDFGSGNTYSLLYKTYDGGSETMRVTKGSTDAPTCSLGYDIQNSSLTSTFKNGSVLEGEKGCTTYGGKIEGVYSWLNSKMGGVPAGYETVFPKTIPTKYDYFYDKINRRKTNVRGFLLKKDKTKAHETLSKDIIKENNRVFGKDKIGIKEYFETTNFDDIQSFSPFISTKFIGIEGNDCDFPYWVINRKGSDGLLKEPDDKQLMAMFFTQLGLHNDANEENWKIASNIDEPAYINSGNTFNDIQGYADTVNLDECGIYKMPYLLVMFYGFCLSNETSDFYRRLPKKCGTMAKPILEYYNKNKDGFVNEIKNLVEELKVNGTVVKGGRNNKDRNQYYAYNFTDNARNRLHQLFIPERAVTFFNFHGGFKSPYDTKDYGALCVDCINGQNTNTSDTENNFKPVSISDLFLDEVKKLINSIEDTSDRIATMAETFATTDKKTSVYMSFKELYDRWKFGAWRSEGNNTNGPKQDFTITMNNFVFVDSHYQNIMNKHYVNLDKFAALVQQILDGSSNMSAYSFIYEVCAMSDITLVALPVNMYEYLNSLEKMEEMFTPYPYMSVDDSAMQTTYVGTYTHKPSEHLNITDPYNTYEDDGVDFSSNDLVVKYEVGGDTKDVPVFGVTYASEDQRIFKNVQVGMDHPKVTAHSIMAELSISQMGSSGSAHLGFEAHDIFDVYATKSYTCRVEMLGNAQIMPVTYFQLNNIPMFKGGYFIVSVEHNINNNGMTTVLTGVRMNRNRFDLKPKNTPNMASTKTADIDDQAGAAGTETRYSTNSFSMDNVNSEKVPYSKKTTLILIDAGHDMGTYGKQSAIDDYATIWKGSTELAPDLDGGNNPGTMRANDVDGETVYSSKGVIDSSRPDIQGRGRYREYWGNRKIAEALKKKLENAGYKNVKFVSSEGVTAGGVKDYSTKINSLYNSVNGNCILVSIHSNAIGTDTEWSSSNYWSVYCQGTEYVKNRNQNIVAPNAGTSRFLGECMGKAAKTAFENMSVELQNEIGKIVVYPRPKVFEESLNGIRPTTFSKPATVLTENLFHTSKEGVKFLGSKKGADFLADIHLDAIEMFFEKVNPSNYVEERDEVVAESKKNWWNNFKEGKLGEETYLQQQENNSPFTFGFGF